MDNKTYKNSYKFNEKNLTSMFVYNVGQQQCEPLLKWGPGIRDHFLIHHIVSGKGVYTVSGRTYHLTAGDTFIVYPNVTVSYQADEDEPYEYYWVGFNGSDASILLDKTDFSSQTPVIRLNNEKKIQELLTDIFTKRGIKPDDYIKMTASLYNFIAFLIEQSTPKATKNISLEYLHNATDYISRNYAMDISINDIAQNISISRSSLYRTFMKNMNISPIDYLTHFRIKKACALLEKGGLSIEEVSVSTGFTDPFYFSRVFKKIVGVPPIKYIKK